MFIVLHQCPLCLHGPLRAALAAFRALSCPGLDGYTASLSLSPSLPLSLSPLSPSLPKYRWFHVVFHDKFVVIRFAKGALGLMSASPNVLVHGDINKCGIGKTSLLQLYVHEQTTVIVKSLHDGGRLGYVTRLMLVKQIKHLGKVTGIQTWQESRQCSLAHKIAFMHDAGINLKGPMESTL